MIYKGPERVRRSYYLSDTYGGENDPLKGEDLDAKICTDFRGNVGRERLRELNIFGRVAVTAHLLRVVLREHDDVVERHGADCVGVTGILLNGAPRTEQGVQAPEFHIAQLRGGLVRIVAPLHLLSAIKGQVEDIERLPNEDNRLFPNGAQFRSASVGVLLEPFHGARLEPAKVSDIPDFRKDAHVGYVDVFGNLNLCVPEGHPLREIVRRIGAKVRLRIGEVVREVTVVRGLNDAEPGKEVIYGQDGNVDVVWKWTADNRQLILDNCAYTLFGRPLEGARVEVEELPSGVVVPQRRVEVVGAV